MSVYKPKGTKYWHYDFQFKGQRFHGSTGTEQKSAAQAFERNKRVKLATEGPAAIRLQNDTPAPDLTLDAAIERWWTDIGERLASASDREYQLAVWLKLLRPKTVLSAIRQTTINAAIVKRRKMAYRGKEPSDATINRFIAALRAVWRHLDSDDAPLPRIKWGKMITAETAEKPPEMSAAKLDALDASLAREGDWAELFGEIAYTYGLRFGEMLFEPSAFDPAEYRIRIVKRRRKRAVTLTITLRPEHSARLAARWARAVAAGLPHLWYVEEKGKLVALRRGQIYHRIARKARLGAGITETTWHGMRHHAATTLLRSSQNLKLVKEALGHASIQSTLRYAHVTEDDLRAAFAALPARARVPK